MPKFRVSATVVGSKYIGEFEAETEEEALELAANSDEAWLNICHRCSSECEDAQCTEFFANKIVTKPAKKK